MPEKKAEKQTDLSKEERIEREEKRLRGVFRQLDKNKLKVVGPLIERAAFYAVSLAELEEIINAEGYTEQYQNGENQKGVKRTAAVDIHLQMTKNYTAITKQLAELAPEAPKKDSKLKAFNRR